MNYTAPAFTTFLDLFSFADTTTAGIFGPLLVMSIFIIVYASVSKSSTSYTKQADGLRTASIVSLISTILLMVFGINMGMTLIVMLVLTAGIILYTHIRKTD